MRAEYRERLGQQIRDLILTNHPELAAAENLLVLDLLVDTMADVRQLRDFINAMGGPVSPRGQLYKPVEMLRARERDAMQLFAIAGIGPRNRAALMAGLGQLAAARQQLAQDAHKRLMTKLAEDAKQIGAEETSK